MVFTQKIRLSSAFICILYVVLTLANRGRHVLASRCVEQGEKSCEDLRNSSSEWQWHDQENDSFDFDDEWFEDSELEDLWSESENTTHDRVKRSESTYTKWKQYSMVFLQHHKFTEKWRPVLGGNGLEAVSILPIFVFFNIVHDVWGKF